MFFVFVIFFGNYILFFKVDRFVVGKFVEDIEVGCDCFYNWGVWFEFEDFLIVVLYLQFGEKLLGVFVFVCKFCVQFLVQEVVVKVSNVGGVDIDVKFMFVIVVYIGLYCYFFQKLCSCIVMCCYLVCIDLCYGWKEIYQALVELFLWVYLEVKVFCVFVFNGNV